MEPGGPAGPAGRRCGTTRRARPARWGHRVPGAGATGATGPAVAAGATPAHWTDGPQGEQGASGPAGADGATWHSGGFPGAVGSGDYYLGDRLWLMCQKVVGAWTQVANLTGPQGLQGEKGDTGAVGPAGQDGATGPQGPKGDKGDTGEIGPAGSQGQKGDTGDPGPAGPKGDTGEVGPKGDTGEPGPKGDTGNVGPKGDPGEAGPAGPQGPTGDTGATGPQGPTGLGLWFPATETGSTHSYYLSPEGQWQGAMPMWHFGMTQDGYIRASSKNLTIGTGGVHFLAPLQADSLAANTLSASNIYINGIGLFGTVTANGQVTGSDVYLSSRGWHVGEELYSLRYRVLTLEGEVTELQTQVDDLMARVSALEGQ